MTAISLPQNRVRTVQRWLVFLGALLLWQVLAARAANPYFPPPVQIAGAAGRLWLSPLLGTNVLPSVARLLGAWAVASVLGVVIGLGLGRSRVVADYFEFLFSFLRTLPPPLLVPVFIVAFGIDSRMEIAVILFGVIWPVLLNTMDGARSVDQVKVDTARAFRISRGRWVLGVVLPAASPKIFAGLRVSLSISLILMVISELGGSTSGIGYQLGTAQGQVDLPGMWAWIVLISLLGYVFNRVLLQVEHRLLAWHRGAMGWEQ
ncbi:ABC transporter permease [Kutzneria viridogrisea]|uniref:ABC transporter, permease component n=2 Tax=Kutzneria TaxID=43356 RepID=W5W834_9PSEU|nr:ABC transporter permease [Kutzneria albida]AHH96900.1 ABC transporter, permease component [Kutzneria albida DSM 43870]MBA8927877.1 ABC-type nitrate/sulfonate/bicarbonate transport system permease component [Kutzneria viridogrisea]